MLDAVAIADAVRSGELSAAEVCADALDRVGRLNPDLGAFVHVDAEGAHNRAAEIDKAVRRGADPGPLAGVPLAVKELHAVEGWPFPYGSRVHAARIADHTSTFVARAIAAGAVPVGLTASPEFGRASFTASELHGVCRNPWDLARTPGGSSGGSAAAVAAGLVPIGTGTDGAGSLRIPASYTGLVGFKGTYGRVPRGPGYGGAAHHDHYGALTATVRDTVRFLDAVCGPDPYDPTSLPAPHLAAALPRVTLAGLRMTWSEGLGYVPVDPEVAEVTREAAQDLIETVGGTPAHNEVTLHDELGPAFRTLSVPEVHQALRGLSPDERDQLHPTVRQYLAPAATLTTDDLVDAHEARHRLNATLARVFAETDLLLTPATQVPAFAAEGPMPAEIAGRPVSHWSGLGVTFPFNLSGHPAVSVPAGTAGGTPIGLQIVARRHEDALVLAAAAAWERHRPWPTRATAYR